MKLTSNDLSAAYSFLRATYPGFRKLPEASAIKFKITRSFDDRGFQQGESIGVSSKIITHSDSLLKVMAHEMAHLKQWVEKTESRDCDHNKQFWKLGHSLCKHYGWDPGLF